MHLLPLLRISLAGLAAAGTLRGLRAAESYQLPAPAILDVLEEPPAPAAQISPDRRWVMTTERDVDVTTIAELAEPTLMLAGSQFKRYPETRIESIGITRISLREIDGDRERDITPPTGGRIDQISWPRLSPGRLAYSTIEGARMGLRIYDVATGQSRVVSGGMEGRIANLRSTLDGRYLAFTTAKKTGLDVWIADTESAVAKKVEGVQLNHVSGAFQWLQGRPPLLVGARVKGELPAEDEVPGGPVVQESYGRSGAARTFQNLLKTPADEQRFEYYFTNQLMSVSPDGRAMKLGPAGINFGGAVSPDGQLLLISRIHRPYSYQVPMSDFPREISVWRTTGEKVRDIVDLPLRDNPRSGRDAVEPGIRSVTWRPDVPATLVLLEALDDGNPARAVPRRDRVSLWPAPFERPAETFAETEMRFGGITWAFPEMAFLSEASSRTARRRTWVIDPRSPTAAPRLLWDRSAEDRYSHPGDWVMVPHSTETREIPLRSSDGRWLYLVGEGASPTGARPFLDRIDVTGGKTERLWQSTDPHYETVSVGFARVRSSYVLDPEARRFVFSRESPTQRPNLFLHDQGQVRQLTDLPEPNLKFAQVKGELIRYRRDDGTELSATLYLPPGYDKGRDGPLPFFLWAYPQEFLTAEGASQLRASPFEFKRPAKQDHLLLLLAGYGVLDGPTMPIVGRNGGEPNDQYVEQLVASARAAIDAVVQRGVCDPERVGVGGHSYGAFMTANLLAHSDLFRAGIARSGAYNRTLTPFGFQAEPRTYWQAAEVYNRMSPFTYAHLIKEPILLIHGMRDSNPGTFPVQSERMFAALKGNGGQVRYVQLPLEDHGYVARESRRHVLWEMISWLDRYVKTPRVKEALANPTARRTGVGSE